MGVAYSEPVTGSEVLASWRLGDRGLGGVVLVVPGWAGQLWGYLMGCVGFVGHLFAKGEGNYATLFRVSLVITLVTPALFSGSPNTTPT